MVMGAAAFGRLCVETESHFQADGVFEQLPSGGCVLKQPLSYTNHWKIFSRLRAAVC